MALCIDEGLAHEGPELTIKMTARMLFVKRIMGILLLFCAVSRPVIALPDGCQPIQERIDTDSTELERQKKELAELRRQFSDSVQRDFASQTEGLADEIDRNKALKVAFSKKRLTRQIEGLQTKLDSRRKQFCDECLVPEDALRKKYCNAPADASL